MRVLHFILGKANKDRANGVNQVIAGLAKYGTRQGGDIRVIGKAETVHVEGECLPRDGFQVTAYSKWAAPLRQALLDSIRWADIVHLHGVYSPWNIQVGRMCDALARPYVVTLHDGLAPIRARVKGRVKKALFHWVVQRGHLERAAAVHTLTEEESTDLLAVTKSRKVFCIPNGVDLEDYPNQGTHQRSASGSVTIGCLSRLSQEKNLDALCRAIARLKGEVDLHLKLAGPVSTYARQLIDCYSTLDIELTGPKFGDDKVEFIRSLDLFVHPSLSDVFSIAGMEVMALGTPLLITRTSQVSYFYDRDAFFMCEPTSFGIEAGIRRVLESRHQWTQRTVNGRKLVEELLNWDVAAGRMLAAYADIVEGR